MSDRLTNDLRDTIRTHAISRTFTPKEEALEAKKRAFADALHAHEYGKEADLVRRLPKEWHNLGDTIYFEGPGWRLHWNDGLPKGELTLSNEQPFPATGGKIALSSKHPLAAQSMALSKEILALDAARTKLADKLRSLLRSVTTVKKLLELWPEGEQFLPTTPTKHYAIVPVSLTREINEMLGLEAAPSAAKQAVVKAMMQRS